MPLGTYNEYDQSTDGQSLHDAAMPPLKSLDIGIALDMHGCPNRCRHCWLGCADNRPMTEQDLRWVAAQFRDHIHNETEPLIDTLTVASWFREPDFSDDYGQLYDLEAELSDGEPARFELLSIWRLARDPHYAQWAKRVGPDTCQITFFGMEDTTDWFYRRKGAFQDALLAAERLLDIGMKPLWQVFLTKKLIPEIGELLDLVERVKLRDRVKALGSEFVLFMHTPAPDGEGLTIEHLRPTIDEVAALPAEIVEPSKKHFKTDTLWHTEAELISQIMKEEDQFPSAYSYPEKLWLMIRNNFDVYPTIGTLDPWWKLGNLKTDPVESLLANFKSNIPLGLKTLYTVSPKTLATRFGDSTSQRVYSDKRDLIAPWVRHFCEQTRKKRTY